MKTSMRLSIVLCLLLASGCSGDTGTIVGTMPGDNLLVNSSFESFGRPSLLGWTANATDTSMIAFSTDVPAGGGVYSVRLTNVWTSPGTLGQMVIPGPGRHRYQLRAMGKVLRGNQFAGGDMSIYVTKSRVWSVSKIEGFTDTVWTYRSLLDTLTTVPGDTIRVIIRGSPDQWGSGYILFDLVEFNRLD